MAPVKVLEKFVQGSEESGQSLEDLVQHNYMDSIHVYIYICIYIYIYLYIYN